MAAGMRLNERIAEGLAALDEAEPLAEAAGMRLELSRLHHLRGNLYFPLGRAAECLHAHERALAEARAAGSLEAEAAALGGLGDAHYLHGRMRSACEQFQACVALARRHGFGRLEVANMPMVGWSLHHLNGTAASIDIGHQAIELATRAEQPRAQLLGRGLVVWVDGLIRGRIDHAEDHAAHAHRLIERLGARRFEAQLRGCAAVFAWRVGDRARAHEQAQTALAICRTHGMGHIGPWVLGVCALVEPDPDARRRWIAEGEAQLERGCVSHNFMSLRDLEIDVFLELGDWEAVDTACARLAAYTAAEPLPLPELRIARGLALSRHGRGERSEALRAELARARDSAAAAEVNTALPALDRALAAYGATAMA
jgi:tetratricopeptide (TPR) repeat protein